MGLIEERGEGQPKHEGGRGDESPGEKEEPQQRSRQPEFPSWQSVHPCKREKMPFHHVTAGLLYKGNYLNRSLSAGSDSEQLANISVEELDDSFEISSAHTGGVIAAWQQDNYWHLVALATLSLPQELGMAMRSLGYMPSEVELAIIMQRLDMDGDGQVDFDEFMTILGPKLVSSEGRDGFLGNTIDSIFWQGTDGCVAVMSSDSDHRAEMKFDMQRITLEELKHILYHAFRDHLTMKDIENIIINEEESLNENSGNCQTEFEGQVRDIVQFALNMKAVCEMSALGLYYNFPSYAFLGVFVCLILDEEQSDENVQLLS
ncbi:hypothetical protein Q9233_002893 [Columba guinea]|nr:hypothetical protein Q9233_002893 [Columba guinea]